MQITRYLCVAAALSLSACASQGYVYDAGGAGHPHPSAALCASWGQRLDTSVDEGGCVSTPAPTTTPMPATAASSLPPPPAMHPSVQTAAKRSPAPSAPRASARVASNASDGTVYNEVKQSTKGELGGLIVAGDHRCGTMNALRPYETSSNKLVCNGSRCCLLPAFQR
jgi:hypothetical protein